MSVLSCNALVPRQRGELEGVSYDFSLWDWPVIVSYACMCMAVKSARLARLALIIFLQHRTKIQKLYEDCSKMHCQVHSRVRSLLQGQAYKKQA